MKTTMITMMALMLTIAAQAQTETIDTAQFVAVYDYECRTMDDEGTPVTDRMQMMVQVGRKVTKSMPSSCYKGADGKSIADLKTAHQEALLHMPTLWTGWPEEQTTIREVIFPHEFEGSEATPNIAWTLLDDTASISGYHCQRATAIFRGIEWHAWYTDEVPSSGGPWRLRGLPGLIVEAESKAHTFTLVALRQEAEPITYERNPDVQRMAYEKLMKHRNEIYGHKRYAKNPTYYIPDLQGSISHMEVYNHDNQQFVFANGYPLLTKVHVYQPLEQSLELMTEFDKVK